MQAAREAAKIALAPKVSFCCVPSKALPDGIRFSKIVGQRGSERRKCLRARNSGRSIENKRRRREGGGGGVT